MGFASANINLRAIILFLIIGIIALVVLFAYVNAQAIANDEKRIADVNQIQASLKLYFDENGFYPSNSNGMPKDIETYLSFWPEAPGANGRCSDEQNTYTYTNRPGTDYWVTFCLGQSGLHRASSKGIE